MDKRHPESNFTSSLWTNLADKYCLSTTQVQQLKRYSELLIEWNEKFNLTAITNVDAIIEYHFDDSLALTQYMDFNSLTTTADIGTGAGFPGLPLKILFPHLHMILIEVNHKKRIFLEHVAQELGLTDIILYPFDWRTFLRTTPQTFDNILLKGPHVQCNEEWDLSDHKIDYFFARASLQPEELVRIFKPSSAHKDATLVYWASMQWTPGKIEAPFVEKEIVYKLDSVKRKFVFFSTPSSVTLRMGIPAKNKNLKT